MRREGVMSTRVARLAVVVAFLILGASDALAGSAISVTAAPGGYHTCALTAVGGVLCWGLNNFGQLGDGTTTTRSTPTAVAGLSSGVAAVAAGGYHTCALTTGGGVVCWGLNYYGQLGDGSTTNRPTPTAVSGLGSGVAAVAAGVDHTCAITTGGGVQCWGYNVYGQLGDGSTTNRSAPVVVIGLSGSVSAVAAGMYHTCAQTGGGGVQCWGYNGYGQLGDGTTTQRSTPTAVSGLSSDAAVVAAGYQHTCATTTAVGVLCWGYNGYGQLGDGTTTQRLTPTAVSGLSSAGAAVAGGYAHTCAVTAGGSGLCWGRNSYGELGDGTSTDRSTPAPVSGLGSGAAAIVGGETHTCALTTGGGVECWGDNTLGELGDGTTTSRSTPAAVTGLGGVPAYSDFTGNHKSDILWRHTTGGDVWLWPMDGAAKGSETYVRTVADSDWQIRGLGDQTDDGMADILWRNKTTGMIYFWPMNGSAPQAESFVGIVDTFYEIVGTGDFDGDGKSDLLWRNATVGDVWIWLMNGATRVSEVYVATADPSYTVKAVGDLNGDHKADLVWHGAAGDVWVWLMNGTARSSQTYVGTVPDTHYQIQQAADFDGNGKADILWWNSVQGDVWIWPMNGAVVVSQSYVGTVADTNYRIVGAGDYDGDLKADILWRNVSVGDVWIWLMNGTTRLSENYVGTVPDTGYQIVNVR
jgi:alpha-tubulin suppressor-like RCC1 family protein